VPLLTRRERVIWIAGFVFASALLVVTKFASADADSVRYATLSARLSELPISRWVAPEWWGLGPDSELSGYFQEHPAGLFFVPAALGRLGLPADQAPYVFGLGIALIALLLIARLVAAMTTSADGRAALVLLQFMPVAFIFRIRDNHEYPMLACLVLVLLGLNDAARTRRAAWLVVAGCVAGLLIKGVFVAFVLLAAGLWILINPSRAPRRPAVLAVALAVVLMTIVAVLYDAWYVRETGGSFWTAYWQRQLMPIQLTSSPNRAWEFSRHLVFYLVRLLFHPAPWSWMLLWGTRLTGPASDNPERERRALQFVLIFTVASLVVLSLASRYAERYLFSTTYIVGAAGAVIAYRRSTALRRWIERADRAVPALPATTWIVLVVLRLAAGRFLPRL
jgi:4-amino-4-deoxy-L-arabinose transferase-like glycosyltransferase